MLSLAVALSVTEEPDTVAPEAGAVIATVGGRCVGCPVAKSTPRLGGRSECPGSGTSRSPDARRHRSRHRDRQAVQRRVVDGIEKPDWVTA
jgi:hypothetical protein